MESSSDISMFSAHRPFLGGMVMRPHLLLVSKLWSQGAGRLPMPWQQAKIFLFMDLFA